MGTRRSLSDTVFSAAKRLPWRKKEPNSDEDKAKIKKRLTESMEEASKYNKSKDHDKAIESYESALEDAKDLFDYDDDDETYYTPRKHRNKVIVDIIERLAETYLLNGNAEEALALYTDLKEDYADRVSLIFLTKITCKLGLVNNFSVLGNNSKIADASKDYSKKKCTQWRKLMNSNVVSSRLSLISCFSLVKLTLKLAVGIKRCVSL